MIKSHAISRVCTLLTCAAPMFVASFALGDTTSQTLPYSQDWSNIGLITVNDDWSDVPGVVGYRGDGLANATGVDPQTILIDGTGVVDVNANQTNPNTFTTGGVTEFHITNPVVALSGSGTARAPFILINLNTSGHSEITISYLLRDIDGSNDNSVQPLALHYRIGSTGDFTNVPAGFVADASSGPAAATLITGVSAELPPDADNQPLVQVRIMTTDAVGSDEWIGVDNITITAGLVDADGDGVADGIDNCPDDFNPSQSDCDHDGIGDVCDDPCPNDRDGDGISDRLDNCSSIFNPGQEDCNQNGIGDVCDIDFQISLDCNRNGIPDECEPDCNGNAVPDVCDISSGASLDVNGNGLPDECENSIAIVLNEILADPPAGLAGDANNDGVRDDSQDEFIELVNNNGSSVNIGGWTISDNSSLRHTFPSNTVLTNQCGIVVFGGGNPTGQFGGMVVQRASSGALGINNAGDTITIRDSLGLLVTSYTFGGEGGDDTSLTRSPDITGFPLVKHDDASPGIAFSPGRKIDLTNFGGCSAQPDGDNDGIPNAVDNCPTTPNPDQADCDDDGIGNACDTDPDNNGNGIPDVCEVLPPANLRLNEIRIDQPSSDNDEYVELKGTPGTSLNGLTILVIGDNTAAQASGVIECIIPLHGHVVPADGHFIVVETTFALAAPAQRDLVLFGGSPGALNFENSENVTFVLAANFSGAINQDLDTDNDGTLDVTPWSHVIDAVGLVRSIVTPPLPVGIEYYYGASLGFIDVGPDGMFVPGQIYRCEATGAWTIGLFDPFAVGGGTDTAGALNDVCAAPPCPADIDPVGGNGVVNVNDLLKVINGWGACPPQPTACPADIDPPGGNGVVNVNDLLKVINGWGACPQ